jgi:hypothetical protein
MKKAIVSLAVMSVLAGSLVASPASASGKPAKVTLYMHGTAPIGELDGAQWAADGFPAQSGMTMDASEPDSPAPKSMNFFSPALNDQCAGPPLAFPTWTGSVVGTIKGDAKLTVHFASAPSAVLARIWSDAPMFSCNDGYIEPAREVEVDVAPGHNEIEIIFKSLNLKPTLGLMIEILVPSGTGYKGQVGRVLYDSADMATSLSFSCTPATGAKSCV